jgi:hypothetical protein
MSHVIQLGSSRWWLWRDAVLRGTGFPIAGIRALGDPALAAAADAANADRRTLDTYRTVFEDATARLTSALRATAADPLFREAVTWQNRTLIGTCLDKMVAGETRNKRGRGHELTVTNYLQRYTLKNDTIGFFGPVGWAEWSESGSRVALATGDRTLARRSVYFEHWAIDTFAAALADDPDLLPWLIPRPDPAHHLAGRVLHRPTTPDLVLSDEQAEVLRQCRGGRNADEVARAVAHGAEKVLPMLCDLRDEGLITLGLTGPVEAYPETTLRRKLERIGDEELRRSALGRLDRLETARAAVAEAAGDADRLASAIDHLDAVFRESTGSEAVRRAGHTYAGRRLVYEDTLRTLRTDLGGALLDELADPLALVLDSGQWLLGRIADEYEALFLGMHQRWSARSGEAAMPLARLVAAATAQLYYSARRLPKPVRTAVDDFQSRWARVLADCERTASGLTADSAALADRVRAEFPPTPARWSTAGHLSPDLMFAASSPEEFAAGRYLAVLGELHLAFNPLEGRVCVEQHPDPDRLRGADAADHGDRRIYLIPPRDSLAVTSRLSPPSALLSPDYTYWTLRSESVDAPGRLLPLAELFVHVADGRTVVRSRAGDFEADLLDVLGEQLSGVSVNSFKICASAPHRPRITVDNLVLTRESWQFDATGLAWAAIRSEADRFAAARAWRTAAGLPERVFYRSPVEEKPAYADFTSLALVNLFAKVVRLTAESPDGTMLTLSELLPELDQHWLVDHDRAAYSSEIRVVARAADGGAR